MTKAILIINETKEKIFVEKLIVISTVKQKTKQNSK